MLSRCGFQVHSGSDLASTTSTIYFFVLPFSEMRNVLRYPKKIEPVLVHFYSKDFLVLLEFYILDRRYLHSDERKYLSVTYPINTLVSICSRLNRRSISVRCDIRPLILVGGTGSRTRSLHKTRQLSTHTNVCAHLCTGWSFNHRSGD